MSARITAGRRAVQHRARRRRGENGRRGSITANLHIHGVQGTSPIRTADNPVHRAMPALNELVAIEWDRGNEFFPPTSMQIANVQAGTGSNNVILGDLYVQFNFRFSTELTDAMIKQRVEELLERHQLNYSIEWRLSGQPFLTARRAGGCGGQRRRALFLN